MGAEIDDSEIRKLAVDLGKAGLKATVLATQAVKKTAFAIEADAKALAPVDTGNLRNSIGVQFDSPLSAEIGPTANYGYYVEYGTSDIDGNPRTSPQPYMGPAFDRQSPGLAKALEQLSGEIL
jgi:HK97 gp10 family phage protein